MIYIFLFDDILFTCRLPPKLCAGISVGSNRYKHSHWEHHENGSSERHWVYSRNSAVAGLIGVGAGVALWLNAHRSAGKWTFLHIEILYNLRYFHTLRSLSGQIFFIIIVLIIIGYRKLMDFWEIKGKIDLVTEFCIYILLSYIF